MISIRILFGIIAAIIGSWFLIHVLAVFGIFFAFASIVLWFIVPEQVPCLSCRIFNIGRKNENGLIVTENFKAAISNFFIILLFSLISGGLVCLEGKLIFQLDLIPTQKTVEFNIPQRGQYRLGEIFPMKLELTGIKTPVNSVQVDLGFSPEKLEVADISTQGSFADTFIQKEIDNKTGYARLTGGLPNPGYQFDRGVFGTVYFRSKQPGLAKVDFLPTSMVLANDGKGSNVIKALGSSSFLILPEEITAEEKEMQSVILGQRVLGEQTEEAKKTQLKLYEEKRILGDETDFNVQGGSLKTNLIFRTLRAVDQFIINLWGAVIGSF